MSSGVDPQDKADLIERFLAGDGRERKALLKELAPHLERDDVVRIAPALRDPSPRIAARITSLLARHELEEELEKNLVGLKPGKIALLRAAFARVRDG